MISGLKIDGENPPLNGEKCRDVRVYKNKIVGSGTQAGITTVELFGCEENVKNISITENDFYGVTSAEALILRDGQVPGTVESVIFSKNKFYDCVLSDVVRTSITSTQITSVYISENEFYANPEVQQTVVNALEITNNFILLHNEGQIRPEDLEGLSIR